MGEDIDYFVEGAKLAGLPGWLARTDFRLKTNTVENATLDSDFTNGKKLVPIVF